MVGVGVGVGTKFGNPAAYQQFSPPTGFAFVTRERNGVVEYAVSPSKNNAYATRSKD